MLQIKSENICCDHEKQSFTFLFCFHVSIASKEDRNLRSLFGPSSSKCMEYFERCTRYQQFCVPTFKHLECRYKGLKLLLKTIAYANYNMFIVILANGRIAAIVSINSVLKLLLNKLFPSQFLKFLNKMFNLSQSWYLKFLRKLQFNLFPKKLQCNLILNNCSSTAHPENCSVKSL